MVKVRIIVKCRCCYNRNFRPNECIDCFLYDHFVDKKAGKKISKMLKKASKKLLYEYKYERIKNKKIKI
ncbi:unnamed protein product [marine sediment metagenome]|uniref:Uncharacterized protein n=1 Tax=marine sediment metagenome TaxID=412755 RepID=X1ID13_9ZZZZ